MGTTYGRQILGPATGHPVMVAAGSGGDMDWKTGGITVDWGTVAAVGVDTTLPDKTFVANGQKVLRFGQILCRIGKSEVQTVDLSGDDDPTGGTWPLGVLGQTLEDLAWNISAADLQTLLRALPVMHADKITVAKAGFVYTITFPPELGNVAAMVSDASDLTGAGGDTFAITIATTTAGEGKAGYYGPYDPAAADGRQNLVPGDCWILNRTVLENGTISSLGGGVTNHPAVLDGGPVWKERILMTRDAHSLAKGPTEAEVRAAFPRLQYVTS
jgi:hypothetical protein